VINSTTGLALVWFNFYQLRGHTCFQFIGPVHYYVQFRWGLLTYGLNHDEVPAIWQHISKEGSHAARLLLAHV